MINGSVFTFAASADGLALYVGGNFTTVNGLTQRRIARFDTTTGQLTSWKPTGWPNNVVRAIAVSADRVYIGGAFTSLGSTTVTRDSRRSALRPARRSRASAPRPTTSSATWSSRLVGSGWAATSRT